MVNRRILMLGGAASVCAMAAGVFLWSAQGHVAETLPNSVDVPAPVADSSALPSVPTDPVLQIEQITLTSKPREQAGAARGELTVIAPDDDIGDACDMMFEATAMPGAIVRLDVIAPCRAGQRITLHHQGMMFSAVLGDSGYYHVDVPALAETAVFMIEPQEGTGAVATAKVPDLGSLDRVVLQWAGDSGFQIHALENNAQYDGEGHVWHGAEPDQGLGQVIRLGDADQLSPQLAEIYSLPAGANGAEAEVEITIEAEITARNCGRDISAQTFSIKRGEAQSQLRTRDLMLSMPDCDAIGDFLVLNNLVENLKIAAN